MRYPQDHEVTLPKAFVHTEYHGTLWSCAANDNRSKKRPLYQNPWLWIAIALPLISIWFLT